MSLLAVFGLTMLVMICVMTTTWFVARKIDNYSIVDPIWSLSFILVTLMYAYLGSGFGGKSAFMIELMGWAWAVRLGYTLAKRIWKSHPVEDGRYKDLREKYGSSVARGFFLFFQIQAVSVVLLSTPFLMVSRSAEPIRNIEWLGLALWVIAYIGESAADHQMARFKHDPANKGKPCDIGLWAYSRHPNYFFESLIWWGFFIFALGSPNGIYTIYAPLFMLYILTCVSGVPPSEAQALRSRGDAYRAYQKRVSVFIPWFPKRGSP